MYVAALERQKHRSLIRKTSTTHPLADVRPAGRIAIVLDARHVDLRTYPIC